jgi:hypothetical protein
MRPPTSPGAAIPYAAPSLIRIGSYPGIVAMAGGPNFAVDSPYNGNTVIATS